MHSLAALQLVVHNAASGCQARLFARHVALRAAYECSNLQVGGLAVHFPLSFGGTRHQECLQERVSLLLCLAAVFEWNVAAAAGLPCTACHYLCVTACHHS